MCFLSVQKKLIDTHTHTHLHTRFPPLTIFYLLVNVPNYSVKQCQRFAAWHAYWNGNAAISEWKSFIHWLLSGFIHDNLLFTCRITLMRGLKGGVCMAFLCFHPRDSCPGERGPHFCCLQLSPLFRRRGLDLVLYHSHCTIGVHFLQSKGFRCLLLMPPLTTQTSQIFFVVRFHLI